MLIMAHGMECASNHSNLNVHEHENADISVMTRVSTVNYSIKNGIFIVNQFTA